MHIAHIGIGYRKITRINLIDQIAKDRSINGIIMNNNNDEDQSRKVKLKRRNIYIYIKLKSLFVCLYVQ